MTDAAIGQITTTAGQVVIAVIALISAVMMRRMDLRQKEQADRQAIRDRNQAIRDRKTITKVNRVRVDIANAKEAAIVTATGVADVLASATNASNDRLDAIHGLVNSNMGTQLRLTMAVSRRLADLTGDPVDIAAANAAARLYAEHQQKQADADFQQGPPPPAETPP